MYKFVWSAHSLPSYSNVLCSLVLLLSNVWICGSKEKYTLRCLKPLMWVVMHVYPSQWFFFPLIKMMLKQICILWLQVPKYATVIERPKTTRDNTPVSYVPSLSSPSIDLLLSWCTILSLHVICFIYVFWPPILLLIPSKLSCIMFLRWLSCDLLITLWKSLCISFHWGSE